MIQKAPTQDGVITRNKAKLKERERRVQAFQEASRGVLSRSKAKELEEELHQAKKTLRTLKKCKNIEESKETKIYNLCGLVWSFSS